MEISKSLDAVTSILMDPSNRGRSPVEKGFAWVATLILGVGTLGIAQCLSALWRSIRCIETNDTLQEISDLFHTRVVDPQNRASVVGDEANTLLPQDFLPGQQHLQYEIVINHILQDQSFKVGLAGKVLFEKVKEKFEQNDLLLEHIDINNLRCLMGNDIDFAAAIAYSPDEQLKKKHMDVLVEQLNIQAESIFEVAQSSVLRESEARIIEQNQLLRVNLFFQIRGRTYEEFLADHKLLEPFAGTKLGDLLNFDGMKRAMIKVAAGQLVGKDLLDALQEAATSYGGFESFAANKENLKRLFLNVPEHSIVISNAIALSDFQEVKNAHLKYLAESVYENRDSYAQFSSLEDPKKLIDSLMNVRVFFRRHGRSLLETFQNEDALRSLLQSVRLRMLLTLYAHLSRATQDEAGSSASSTPRASKPAEREERLRAQAAYQKGLEHAPVAGFITQIGGHGMERQELRKHARQVMGKQHPDRGGDPMLFAAANELNQLIQNEQLDIYLRGIQKGREDLRK